MNKRDPWDLLGLLKSPMHQFRNNLEGVGIGLVLLAVVVQFARIIERPYGDFPSHWEWGRRFASGEFLYAGGLNIPYPPFWGMVHAPLTVFPPHAAQIIFYPISLLAAVLLFWVLHQLTMVALPYRREQLVSIVLLTLLLSARYWLRDLLECLPNLFLVAMSWLSIHLWSKRREWAGGMVLGFAAALKCTPLLFVPYFLLKRQWKMVARSLLFAGIFTMAPIVTSGLQNYLPHIERWAGGVLSGLTEQDPSFGVLGDAEYQNMALRPALARFLVKLPEGHRGRIDHPSYVDVFDLPADLAGGLVWAVMGALLALVLWRMRAPVDKRVSEPILWECAAISLLILLYSPITWGQHYVGVIPACYLIVRQWIQREPFTVWMKAGMGIYILFTIILNKKVVGHEHAPLVESYHVETFGIFSLLAVVMGFHARARARNVQGQTEDQRDST